LGCNSNSILNANKNLLLIQGFLFGLSKCLQKTDITASRSKTNTIYHTSIQPDAAVPRAKKHAVISRTELIISHAKYVLCAVPGAVILTAFMHMKYFDIFISKSSKENNMILLIMCVRGVDCSIIQKNTAQL